MSNHGMGKYTGMVVITLATLLGVAPGTRLAAALPNEACEIPAGLDRLVAVQYPGTRLVGTLDLEDGDRKLFQSDHGNDCPGLVKLDFFGDGQQALAMVLKARERNVPAKLVLAHHTDSGWKMQLLDTGGSTPDAPVVWSQPPGEYQNVYGEKRIRADRPVIVFCKYESWAILYAWTGTNVKKIWIADQN